ncbi:GntR family transcriptional regulator [Aggregatimonas sangjinii]|uniref:GntR family transcriptional regulator n=1 Tax=Aggregatimonas sangjinii TaxID=2583587 RepID=A0A5B7SSR9_9FLAO|nr:GntR family transcriptional regulator [Aggregatimonas sangjinii]QCX00048.1 GntR family transcriptional regulator [Aggregatimonas sangjinii]
MNNKANLRDTVREYLLQQMRKGHLNAGDSINLAALSRELNVSVTPIREALTQLQQSQVIEAIPNRGFFIKELSNDEAKNLYEIVAQLEVLALEQSHFDEGTITYLRTQQKLIQQADDPLERINAYMDFHTLLTKNYGNSVAQQILGDLRTRVFLYEKTFMADDSFYYNSDNQHEAIISAIEEDNLPSAALVLRMNWLLIQDYIEKQLILL